MDQLDYVDSLVRGDRRGRTEHPPGLYVMYVLDSVLPPASGPSAVSWVEMM
jgi:hypothetical protein